MPKMRLRIPIEIDLTDEEQEALSAIGDAANRVRSSGVAQALTQAFTKTRSAVETLRRGRRRVR